VLIGFILVITGIVFDFGFVRTPDKFVETVENNYNAWQGYIFNLMRFYLIIMGLLNIAFALFLQHLKERPKLSWINFFMLEGGGIVLFTGLIWGTHFNPGSFTDSFPYYLEVFGLLTIITSIIVKVLQIIHKKDIN